MESAAPLFLHHVGFVVAEVRSGMEAFVASLGATWDGIVHEDPLQKVKLARLRLQTTLVAVSGTRWF